MNTATTTDQKFIVRYHTYAVRFLGPVGRWGSHGIEVVDDAAATVFPSENAAREAIQRVDVLVNHPDGVKIEPLTP